MGRGSSGRGDPFALSVMQDTVYHGTNVSGITSFRTDGEESNGAIFFSESEDYAEEEAYLKQERLGGTQNVYGVKLNIRNPLTVILNGAQFSDPIVERRYIQQAKTQGYDAVIFQSNTGNPLLDDTFYAVFSPEQIKIINRRQV